MRILLALLLLLHPVKRIHTIFYSTPGDNAMNLYQARTLAHQIAAWTLRDHNIRLVYKVIRGHDHCGRVDVGDFARAECLRHWEQFFHRYNKDTDTLKIAVTKPLYYEGYWIAEEASRVCAYRRTGIAYCAVEMFNEFGEYKEVESWYTCYQGLSHLMGADFDDHEYNINGATWVSYMHYSALDYQPNLYASDITQKEVSRCVN